MKYKKLYRSPKDALVFGIAAGIGHYFEVDPVFVRLALIVLTVLTSTWIVPTAYLALFFIIPIDPTQQTVAQHQEPKDVTPEKART